MITRAGLKAVVLPTAAGAIAACAAVLLAVSIAALRAVTS
jgi:hypothetical protein